jgi:hypothetical protein
MIRDAVAAVLLGAALAGCATATTTPPSAATAAATVTAPAERQVSPRFVAFVGPVQQHDPPFLGVRYSNFDCLRSFLDRQTGEVAHQLYVADSYFGAKRHWDGAEDGAGQKLPFVPISNAEITCGDGCAYADEFAADLPDALLRSSTDGLSVIFAARSGDRLTIRLSGGEIQQQLAAVDTAKRLLASPTAATLH